jgi:hypothetical protein
MVDFNIDIRDGVKFDGVNQGPPLHLPCVKNHGADFTNEDFDSSADSPILHKKGGEEDGFAWKSVRNCISLDKMVAFYGLSNVATQTQTYILVILWFFF